MSRRGGFITRTHLAELDVIECAVFLSESSDEVAERFVSSVESTAEKLLGAPNIGREVERQALMDQHLRWWPVDGFPNHLLFYREVAGGIQIVRVLHGARDWLRLIEDE
jgi:toxin ParE1/3/4